MVLIFDLIGVIGMMVLIAAFILNVKKHTRRRTILYNGLNLVGAVTLCVYAYLIGSQVFVILQLIWSLIALYFLISILHERHVKPRFEKKKLQVKKKSKKI